MILDVQLCERSGWKANVSQPGGEEVGDLAVALHSLSSLGGEQGVERRTNIDPPPHPGWSC